MDELCRAAAVGDREAVQRLLAAQGVDVNAKNSCGRAPLNLAAASGHVEIVRLLFAAQGVDVDVKDYDDRAPLHDAAEGGHVEVVRLLLAAQGVDVNAKNGRGRAPLHDAAEGGHVEVVRLLLAAQGVDVNAKDSDDQAPLHDAAEGGHVEIVRLLLAAQGVDVNAKERRGWAPLHDAAKGGHVEIVRQLLAAQGVDVNAKERRGQAPLHDAAEGGHVEVVRLLLAVQGVDVNAKDCSGRAPLHDAAKGGHVEIVRQLLAVQGVDVNAKDCCDCSPLHDAAEGGHVEVVRLLLAAQGVDVTAKNGIGRAPLHDAAKRGHVEIVRQLLAVQGVDVNAKNGRGRAPLYDAAEGGHVEIVRQLLASSHKKEYLNFLTKASDTASGAKLLYWDHNKEVCHSVTVVAIDAGPEASEVGSGVGSGSTFGLGDPDMPSWILTCRHADIVHGRVPSWDPDKIFEFSHGGRGGASLCGLGKLSLEAKDGCTPLHVAAQGGYVEIVELLLDSGMDAHLEDSEGNTPLHCAILRSSQATSSAAASDISLRLQDVCRLLWAAPGAGADAQVLYFANDGGTAARGISPLHYAVNLRQEEIVRLLVEQGAMVDRSLLVRWLTSDRRAEWELVDRLVQQRQITDEQRKVLCKNCLDRLPGDARLGDSRLLPLGVLKGSPSTCAQWAEKVPSDNPFVVAASGKRSELEWTTAGGSGRIFSSFLSVTQPTKKVPVTLSTCQADAAACSHPSVIKVLGETQNMELLSTHFVEAIIRHTWNDYKAYAFVDIIINVIILAVALYTSALVQAGDWTAPEYAWAVVVLGCGIGKRCVEEAAQLYSSCAWRQLATLLGSAGPPAATHEGPRADEPAQDASSRPSSPTPSQPAAQPQSNVARNEEDQFATPVADLCTYMKDSFVDLLILFTSVRGWFALLADDFSDEDRFFLALWFATLWLRVVYSLRVVEAVGTRFLPIFRAVQSTGKFFVVVGFFFCACVHAYYMLGVRAEPSPSYAAFLQVFRLGFLGDFDLFEFEGVDPTYVNREGTNVWDPEDPSPSPAYAYTHIIFFLISTGITLLLMNLLIGVLGAAYDVEEDRASQIYLQNLASYVHTARSLPWAKRWRKIPSESEPSYLYFLARESDAADATTSMRSFLKNSMSQQDATLDAKLAAMQSQQDAKLAALDAKLAQLIKHAGC